MLGQPAPSAIAASAWNWPTFISSSMCGVSAGHSFRMRLVASKSRAVVIAASCSSRSPKNFTMPGRTSAGIGRRVRGEHVVALVEGFERDLPVARQAHRPVPAVAHVLELEAVGVFRDRREVL